MLQKFLNALSLYHPQKKSIHTEKISLLVLTYDEWIDWKYSHKYEVKWPLYDKAYFIDASQATEKLDTSQYRQIQVNSDEYVSKIIKVARESIPGYDKNFYKLPAGKSHYVTSQLSYSLYYPALDNEALSDKTRISELGIENFDILVIRQQAHIISASYMMLPVRDFSEFQKMVLKSKNPTEEIDDKGGDWRGIEVLSAVLLYTDEDTELAKYVREYFDKLHQMSGPNIAVYVVESAPKDSKLSASSFWKLRVNHTSYHAWSLLGWTQSKPYDKSASYEIARSLNIYPDQIPCLALFTTVGKVDKIIFPIDSDFSTFFRITFSNIQRVLKTIDSNLIYDRRISELFNELNKSIKQAQVDTKADRTVYNFYGQSIFINHQVNTEGGAYIEGSVNTDGGPFVGRDKTE